jgi:uncharacterized repeat protein (TIGR01451 family)
MRTVLQRAGARATLLTSLAVLIALGADGLAQRESPITMTNVGSPSPVVSGGELTYTITMMNTGGAKVSDVVLNDQFNGVGGIGIPPQLQIATTRGSCSQTVNGVTCQAGQIEGNGTWVVTIRGKVVAPAGTTLNNTATVTGTKAAQNFTTTTTTSVLVSGNVSTLADLTIAKTGPTAVVYSTPADPSPLTYTLTVNNQGLTNATDVVVVDTLPDGLTGITAAGTSLFQCAVAGQTVTCLGGAVNAGANATITINALAPLEGLPITLLTNTAVVDPEDQIPEGNELNNTSALVNTQVVAVPPVDPISINITDDPAVISGAGPDPVVPGGNVTFKILVTNNDSTRADDVAIVLGTQSLEPSSVMVSNPPTVVDGTIGQQGGCAVSASETQCLVRTLNPGGTILMTVTGKVIGFAGSSFISTASVTGNIKNQGVSSTDTELTTIKPYIDLTITKKDSPDPVCARSWPGALLCGGGLKYLLTIGNSGMNAAAGVVVRDPLPAGTILDSYTTDGGFTCTVDAATNVLTCTGGTIPTESTKQIEVTLVAPPYVGSISNTATVDPFNAIFESDDTNNTGSAQTVVSTGIDLSVTKTADLDPIATGGTLTYTLVVENNGPQDAANIRLRDTLPTGTVFRDIVQITNGFTCSHAAGTLECIGGSVRGTMSESYVGPNAPAPLGPDAATIKFRVFAQTFEGTMHNEVRVDPLNEIPEINENNNIATLDTSVVDNGPGAFNDLEIKKEGTATTTPGGPIDYTISVWNTGTDPAPNVTVRDVLPAGVTFVSATDGGGPGSAFTCAHNAGVVTCIGATIMPNTDATTARKINISVTAPNQNVSLTNEAIVDPDNVIPEGSERDNTATWVTQVQSVINLSITKTGPPTSSQSQPGEYVITVKNNKSGDGQTAFDVEMHDPLPVGLIPLAAEIDPGQENNWACQISQNPINVVDCVGDLAPDQSVTIRIAVFMTAETGKSLDNEACVDPRDLIEEFGPGESDNCSTHTTIIVPKSPNLTLTKTASPSSVTAGQELVYTLLIQNVGDATAVGLPADGNELKVSDTLPASVTFVDANATDTWTCTYTAPTVTCTDGGSGLAPGAAATITIRTTVNTGLAAPIVNAATATSPAQTTDPGAVEETADHLDDNTATVTTSVGGSPFDLVLSTITDNPDPASPGQVVKYTIVAVNAGTDAANNVKILVNLPLAAAASFEGADGTNGFNCTALDVATNTVSCVGDLPPGGDTTITVTSAVLLGLIPPADLTLTATIDPDLAFAEANEGNNQETEVTSVSGISCSNCVDLVTTELTAVPGVTGTETTFTARIVNVGDTATALDPTSDALVRLTIVAVTGDFTAGTPTFSDPAFAPLCTVTTIAGPPKQVLLTCRGNLGPSQGLTMTLPVTGVTGDLGAVFQADPTNLITPATTPPEFREDNNLLIITVLHLF